MISDIDGIYNITNEINSIIDIKNDISDRKQCRQKKI